MQLQISTESVPESNRFEAWSNAIFYTFAISVQPLRDTDRPFRGHLSADSGVLSQSLPTTVGKSYIVAFDYGAVDFSLPQSMNVSIVSGANTLNTAISATGKTDFATLFSPYAYAFTADAVTTTLTFEDTSVITDDVDGLVGDVSAATANHIPEPSSFALLGTGIASVGARRLVRSRAART